MLNVCVIGSPAHLEHPLRIIVAKANMDKANFFIFSIVWIFCIKLIKCKDIYFFAHTRIFRFFWGKTAKCTLLCTPSIATEDYQHGTHTLPDTYILLPLHSTDTAPRKRIYGFARKAKDSHPPKNAVPALPATQGNHNNFIV